MKTETLETLNNSYMADIEEKTLKQEVVQKKLTANLSNMKDTISKIQLGDDSKVDEAILISFFASLFDDITEAYKKFKDFGYKMKIENLNNDKSLLQEKIDNIKSFKNHSEKVNHYTQLNIEKTSLENKIQKLNEQSAKNAANGVITITDTDELGIAEKRLGQVLLEMDNIADFYGYETNEQFMQDLERSENKSYGEVGSSHLRAVRKLDTDATEQLLISSSKLSGMDQERIEDLRLAYKSLEKLSSNALGDDETKELVSQFYRATVGVESSIQIQQLAQDGARILKEQNNTEFGTKSSQPVQDFV